MISYREAFNQVKNDCEHCYDKDIDPNICDTCVVSTCLKALKIAETYEAINMGQLTKFP